MAKRAQKPAASDGKRSTKTVQNKIKKMTLEAKKCAPSKPMKGLFNPPSVVKVKIKPTTECNDLVPPEAAANVQTPEVEKVLNKIHVNKMQKCKNKLPAGADKTISRTKQLKYDEILKPKASKPRAQRSVKPGKFGGGTLQPEEETDLVPPEAAANVQTPEVEKVLNKSHVKKKQKCKDKLPAVADKTISRKKQPKSDEILKQKASKPRAQRSVKPSKFGGGTLQPEEETGAEVMKGTGRKCITEKEQGKVPLQIKSEQMTLDGITKPDDILKSDTPVLTKRITKKPRTRTTVVEPVKESVEDDGAEKNAGTKARKRKIIVISASEKKGKGQAKECETNQLESKNTMIMKKKTTAPTATSAQTDFNKSPIFSCLSLVAKPATFNEESKHSADKVVLNNTLSACSGFTCACEISSTSSTSRGYCIPINGKVPILRVEDVKNSLMYPLIKSITKSEDEEKISEGNMVKNMDENTILIQNGNTETFNVLRECRSHSKERDLSSSSSCSSCTHSLSSSLSSSDSSETSKHISVDKCADLAKVQNILQNIDFSWIDEIDQMLESNNFIEENCNNIMSLSHCMSTDKEELQVACENLQDTLEITKVNNEKLLKMTPSLSESEIVPSDLRPMEEEILKKPNMKIATPERTTIPIQTNISSDFINLDDDVISLFAESLATFDMNTVLAKKQTPSTIKLLPPIVGNVKPTVKTLITHTFMKPTKVTSDISSTVTHPDKEDDVPKIKVQNPTPAEKVVCKKQSADSTSVLRDNKCADSETNSSFDPHESKVEVLTPRKHHVRENRRDEQMSAEMPCSTIPNCITAQRDRYIYNKTLMSSINTKLSAVVFAGVCFKNLRSKCTNRKCQYSHRILSPDDIKSRLSVVPTEICIHSYLIMKRHKVLCDRFLKVFIKVFASKKLSNVLFEIIFDIHWHEIVTDTLECMLLCLDELNTLDITECEDFFLNTLPDQSFLSEELIVFILRLGCFLRYAPILSKLVTLFYERNIPLQIETVHNFVQVICATEMDMAQKQFLKLVYEKCVKNTDSRIFCTVVLSDWDKFGQRLTQFDLTAELKDLWLQIQPKLFTHKAAGLLPGPSVQCGNIPDGLMPSLLDVKLNTNSLFIKPPFIRNHPPYRPIYSNRKYGVNGPRGKGRPHPTNRVAGAVLKFRKNIQQNSRFVAFGGPRPPSAFPPQG